MSPILDALLIDTRHACRRLRHTPGFSLVVVATLALTIAAFTTVFSLLNAVFLRPIGAPDPDRLVSWSATNTQTLSAGYFYLDAFKAFRAEQRSFSGLSLYAGSGGRVETANGTWNVGTEGVMPEYFGLVAARLVAGRFLTVEDETAAVPSAVISARFWRKAFDAKPSAVGGTMKFDARDVTIVGVMADGFVGMQLDSATDVFLSVPVARANSSDRKGVVRAPYVVGRLAPGVSLAQAQAEVGARWPVIQDATAAALTPAELASVRLQRVELQSVAHGFSGQRRQWGPSFLVLVGLASVLLAIGCVNLMALMSARGLAREREVAVCLALGVGRARLFQQLTVDGLLLAAAGLATAIPLAWWSCQVLTATLSVMRGLPLQRPMTPDGLVLSVATSVAIVMGLVIGLLPTWRAINGDVAEAVRGGRTVVRTLGWSGRVVLVTQIALSMVLLVGAGLFVGMLSQLHANTSQFGGGGVVWTRLTKNPGDRTTLEQPYFQNLVERMSAIPGVDSAVLSSYFPAYWGYRGPLPLDQYSAEGSSEAVSGLGEFVTPGFFDAFGIARLRGRDFTWADSTGAPPVAIVSQTLAGRLFPDGDAIGKRLGITAGAMTGEAEIVGVVSDAAIGSIREPHQGIAFRPMMQHLTYAQFPLAHVRVNGDAASVRDAYTRVVEAQGHHYIRGLFTLDQWFGEALLQERLIGGMSTAAATMAVLLVCLGIYGVLAYAVVARVREIGVRMALGATGATVVRMIVRDGLAVVVPGILIGIPSALAAATLVRSQLYGVSPTDPATVIGSAVVFVVTGIVAALLPALRASRIDPVDALRQE